MKKIIIFLIITIFLSYSTFKTNTDQPDECNDMRDIMNLTVKSNGVFSKGATTAYLTLLTLHYSDCKNARKEKKKNIIAKFKLEISKLKLENSKLKIKLEYLEKK